jgi:threonine/homoserine/homoserine lactone efflux protein
MALALIAGFVLGFISAVPIAGPISALVFSQGMKGKPGQGRWVAFGAAIVEAVYCFVALWGVNLLLPGFTNLFVVANALAAVALGALGVYFFRSKRMRTPVDSPKADAAKAAKGFAMGAGICAMNPSLIATWAASSATIYSMGLFSFTIGNAGLFAAGVGTGIFTWFAVLLRLVSRYRDRLGAGILDKLLKFFGSVLIALSLVMVYRLFNHRP